MCHSERMRFRYDRREGDGVPAGFETKDVVKRMTLAPTTKLPKFRIGINAIAAGIYFSKARSYNAKKPLRWSERLL